MASKIKKSQIIRHIIQLIAFILLPGLYSMTFSEVKTVYQMIINSNFNFFEALPSLIEFVAIMLLTIVLGRWFCGWICAFGAYNDLIYFISKKVFKIKFRADEKVDSILKYFKYVVLLFIIAISWTMGSSILESTSPWDAFGQITDVSTIFSSLLVGLIFLILITIGAAFIERFFCRYLCPLGAIFSIISKIGIVKINKPKADCGKCRACTMNCSMGLPLYRVDCVKGGDCINCLKCTEVCYRNNANVNLLGRDLDAKLTGSVAMATFLGVYGLTNFAGNAVTKSGIAAKSNAVSSNLNSQTESAPESSKLNHETTSSNTVQNNASEYKDGTYTGSGTGYKGGTTKISVTVSDGKISSIQAISNQDTPKFYQRAEGTIIKSIISKQSTSVDTVSGATYSSKGIMSAVTNALNEAK
ncbi:ferredoxin [Clostridium beijerinckii]|uniref:Ferredoxin n=1 Tax=Clostridium beijerinckii TaxID=1520 RepID=A0A0B5QX41_CLOBE|nr:4Fe-4S binding protein [Clostridium beijerinckii]AJH01554.1 ferredoxin [Clostridium beijerinckii]